METVQRMLAEEVPESLDNRIFTLEELVQKENHSQEQMKSMLLFFTLVCLSITVLGIYSAISIDTERRRKEIAIRKINGASAYVIVRLFARLYLRLLVAAMVLTFPFLNWIMHLWLQGFTLHFGSRSGLLDFYSLCDGNGGGFDHCLENTRDHPGESGGGTEG